MSGMQNRWLVGVNNRSSAIMGSDKRVWVTMGFDIVSNRGGEVVESMVILLHEIQARKGGHWDEEQVHNDYGLGEGKQPDIHDPSLK